MKTRAKPKAYFYYRTMRGKEQTGFIQLVSYMIGKTAPHIEYEIKENYRNQGIMTRHLPKYLNLCKKEGINQLMAIVKKDNIYSQRLLEKNDFVMLSELEDEFCYVIDIRLTRSKTLEIMKIVKRDFNFDRESNAEG